MVVNKIFEKSVYAIIYNEYVIFVYINCWAAVKGYGISSYSDFILMVEISPIF